MIKLTECNNIFVVGPVSSGKTNLINVWLENINRYVRFDYTGETTGKSGVEHCHTPFTLLERMEKNQYFYRIAYHPGKNVMEHYKWCQKVVWAFDEPRWLIMDEYHRVCPQNKGLDPDVESALRLARHNQLGIVGASQRPQDVNKLYVDSCRMCVIFRSQEENFLNACAGHWGDQVADAVAVCRPNVYDEVNKISKQVPQCVVVTRDGREAQVYDFGNDQFVPVSTFLNLKDDGEKPDALRTDLDEERPSGESVHDDAGNPLSE
jgi:hypothetical protein